MIKYVLLFIGFTKYLFKKLPDRNEHFISVKKLVLIIQSILDAVSYSEIYPVFVFHSSSKQLSMYTYKRYLNTYYQKVTEIKTIQSEGFYICIKSKNTTFAGGHLFQCNNSHHILHSQICNGKIECHHTEEDEKFCSCDKHRNFSEKIFCNTVKLIYPNNKCSPLYFITVQGFCHQFDKLSFYEMKTIVETKMNNDSSSKNIVEIKYNDNFICNDGTILDLSLIDDLEADCGPDGEDEPMLLSILLNNTSYSCMQKYELPCRQHHSKCYSLKDICTYELNRFHHITPCRNGGHLQNCKESCLQYEI